jgi:hypothetical protein
MKCPDSTRLKVSVNCFTMVDPGQFLVPLLPLPLLDILVEGVLIKVRGVLEEVDGAEVAEECAKGLACRGRKIARQRAR